MTTMSVKITGNAKAKLLGISKRTKQPGKAWVRVGSYLASVNRRSFATQGASTGKPWKPLKPEYLQWKIERGFSRRILMQTGSMRLSFVSRPMAVERYNGSSAYFGSDHRLAKFHQYGTFRNGRRVLPARPIIRVTKRIRSDVRDILADSIAGRRTRNPRPL